MCETVGLFLFQRDVIMSFIHMVPFDLAYGVSQLVSINMGDTSSTNRIHSSATERHPSTPCRYGVPTEEACTTAIFRVRRFFLVVRE